MDRWMDVHLQLSESFFSVCPWVSQKEGSALSESIYHMYICVV